MRPRLLLPLLLYLLPMPTAVPEMIIGAGFDAEIYPADSDWEPALGLSLQLGEYLPISRDAGFYFDGSGHMTVNPLTGGIAGAYDLSADVSLLAEKLYLRWLVGSAGTFALDGGDLGFDTAFYLSLGNDSVSFSLDPRLRVGILPATSIEVSGDLGLSWSVRQKLLIELALPCKLAGGTASDREAALGIILGFAYYPPAFWVLEGECAVRRETSTALGAIDTVAGLPVGSFWELAWGVDVSLVTVRSTVFAFAVPGYLRRKDHGPVVEGVLQADRHQWDLELEPGLEVNFHPEQNVGLFVSLGLLLLLSTSPEAGLFSTSVSFGLDITV